MPMKEPFCQHCSVRHWPKDGCSLIAIGCKRCDVKDLEIQRLTARVESLETDDLQKLARQALARREYQRNYMRKVRSNG